MDKNKTAIIIGAGIGGIATSIYLAKNGYKVSIFEKNSGPGGRCGQLIHEGHRFDLGATMLLMPGVYREVFSSLGIDLDKTLEIKQLDELYKLYFDDGKELTFTTDLKKMETQLETIEKGSFRRAQKLLAKQSLKGSAICFDAAKRRSLASDEEKVRVPGSSGCSTERET